MSCVKQLAIKLRPDLVLKIYVFPITYNPREEKPQQDKFSELNIHHSESHT